MQPRTSDHTDGEIDEENPTPGIIEGDPSAQGRANSGRDDGGDAVECECQTALLRRKSVGENGLRHRLKPAAACALQDAEQKKEAQARRDTTEQRTHSKEEQAGHEKPLPAQCTRQPAADRQHDGVRDQIRSQDPRALVVAGAQISGHVGQGDVGDAGVEDLHEGCQGYDDSDQPGIIPRPPFFLVEGEGGGAHWR